MALDVYFREDILNVLRATYAAADGPASLLNEWVHDPRLNDLPLDRLVEVYRQGFCTALGAVGLAFGLEPSERRSSLPSQLSLTACPADPRRRVASACHADASGPELDLPAFLHLGAEPDRQRA